MEIIPIEVIQTVESELSNLAFGRVTLEISRHDNRSKYRITKETSFIPGKETSGAEVNHA